MRKEPRLSEFKRHLQRGKVYRREELNRYTNSVDRHVAELQKDGTLVKVAPGLYYYPKVSPFGKVPAEDKELVRAFLKNDKFLLTSPNAYNSLGIGTTQLYDRKVVYNRLRHGLFTLGERTFEFRFVKDLPNKVTKEYLVVDLLNNLEDLAEDPVMVKNNVAKLVSELDTKALDNAAKRFGKVRTKKFLARKLVKEAS